MGEQQFRIDLMVMNDYLNRSVEHITSNLKNEDYRRAHKILSSVLEVFQIIKRHKMKTIKLVING